MKSLVALAVVLVAAAALATDLEDARALIAASRLDEARAVLDRTVKDPAQRGASLVLLTRIGNRTADWESAVAFGKQAVAALPASSEAHFEYAVALRVKMTHVSKLRAMGSLGDYKDELAAAIRLDATNVPARLEEIGFLVSAPGFAGGDMAKARKKIAELRPLDARSAALMEVQACRKEGNLDGALTALRSLLDTNPTDHAARLSLGLTLQEMKRYRDAEQELAKLLPVQDGTWSLAAAYQLARTRILGRYEPEKAVELLLDYIARVPEKADGLVPTSAAHWRLGNAYEQLGQLDAARLAYERAVALDATNEDAKKALKALSRR